MLSGPQLIQVAPNTSLAPSNGPVLNLAPNANTIETQSPTQMTFTFSPGASIDPSTLNATSLSVARHGGDAVPVDGTFNIPIAIGSYSVDPNHGNLVTIRFQDTLPDDLYQITITGALKDTNKAGFNSGVTKTVDFQVDFGAQVVSVVPQPVLRSEVINVATNASQTADGQTFAISLGGGTPVTFQLKNSASSSVIAAGNVGVTFNPGDSASVIAGDIATAINTQATTVGKPLRGGLVTPVTAVGATVSVNGTAFTPAVTASPTTLNVVDATKITDGDTFSVLYPGQPLGLPVTFQFRNSSDMTLLNPSNVTITYNTGDSATTLATDIVNAINGSSLGAGTAARVGTMVQFGGNPTVTLVTAKTGFLSLIAGLQVTDGGLRQALDTIDVYFNQDPLPKSLAQDPAFYQAINITDGSILQPATVTYNPTGNTAVLKFAAPLPDDTFRLQIGAPKANNTTTGAAVNAGAIVSNLDLMALAGTTTWSTVSNSVTGVGTYFTTLTAGQVLEGPDGNFYQVASVASDTSLTLSVNYFGVAQSGFTTYTPLTAGKFAAVAGTTFWNNGSTSVTGSGTLFTRLIPGQILQGPDGDLYRVANVGSDNSLTLTAAYNGSSTPSGPGAVVEALPPGGYGVQGYLGNDPAGSSTDVNSVNLYQFQVNVPGIVTISALNLAPGLAGNVYLRLFDSTGLVELANSTNTLTIVSSGPTTYYLGVSSAGNTSYNAVIGTGAAGGTGFGSYLLNISSSNPLNENSDTSSFATAAALGTLGSAGFTISGQIAPLGNLAYPALPGGPGTPGNRDLGCRGRSW